MDEATKQIVKLQVKHEIDAHPDLSYLETKYTVSGTDKRPRVKIISSCRYGAEDLKRYGHRKVLDWIVDDMKRLESYGNHWSCIGVLVGAEIRVKIAKNYWHPVYLRTAGVWGIESDSSQDYLAEVAYDEFETMHKLLVELGFTEMRIAEAAVRHLGFLLAWKARKEMGKAIEHVVGQVVENGTVSEYKTPGDFLRDAVLHKLHDKEEKV